MSHLITAVKTIFRLDSVIDEGPAYVLGSTADLTPTRYLILLGDDPNLNSRLHQSMSSRASRWLSRVANLDLPKSTVDNDRIHKTVLIKTSPGPVEVPANVPVTGAWEVVHLNDVLARLVLGLPSLAAISLGHHSNQLVSPLDRLVAMNPERIVKPSMEELDTSDRVTAVHRSSVVVHRIVDWITGPNDQPFLTIFGIGGLGKTTLLELVGRELWEGFITYQHSCIPALVPLGEMPAGATYGISAHISNFPAFKRLASAGTIEAMVRAGLLSVFMDAFDEHLKFTNRAQAVRFLSALRSEFCGAGGRVRLVLTSRDYYLYTDKLFREQLDDSAVRFRLLPFDETQRREFIRLRSQGRDGFTEEQALQWAAALEEQVNALRGSTEGIDQLVGHSLFLLAYCDFIARPKGRSDNGQGMVGADPESFKLRSSRLFDEVITLINQREEREKSRWDNAVHCDLKEQWSESPFTPEKQARFFSEITKRLVQSEGNVPKSYILNPQLHPVEQQVGEALRVLGLVPEARATLDRSVRQEAEAAALAVIVDFFKNHPLVDGSGNGFTGDTFFTFRHETYRDYFVKEYLCHRFTEVFEVMTKTSYGRVAGPDQVGLLVDIIVELFHTRLLERATNALFFLCWDDRALADLKLGLRALFLTSAQLGIDADIFSKVLQYSLLFVKLYRELRNQETEFSGLVLHPGGDAVVAISGEEFGSLLTGITLSLCSIGHLELSNVTFTDCKLLRVSVRHLGVRGTVTFEGGTLYLIPEDEINSGKSLEDAVYPAEGDVTVRLRKITVHHETMDALKTLASIYPNFHFDIDDTVQTIDFEQDATSELQSAGRRFVNTLMRLMRKHDRLEFGAFDRKVFGRTQVLRDRENEVIDVLRQAGIVDRDGNMIIMKNPQYMYHPERLYGREWSQVSDLWEPLIARIDDILERGQGARIG